MQSIASEINGKFWQSQKILKSLVSTLIRRLVDNSSMEKVYNYKTFQIKRSKYATISKKVPYDTYSILKKIHNDLKITEPRITYDEIIWRLIENDKTINLFS